MNMYKKSKLNVNDVRVLATLNAHMQFPEQKGTPALQAMIDEAVKEGVRYFYQVQCERKLYDRYRDKWFSQMKSEEMIKYMPEELYPNVEEWLDDKEISEIPYGDLSIKRIMHWHKTKEGPVTHSFPQSAVAMGIYVKNGCRDINDALNRFRYVVEMRK